MGASKLIEGLQLLSMTSSLYGYIEEKGRSMDPGVTGVACAICVQPLVYNDICMVEIGNIHGRDYFYRAHQTCFDALNQDGRDVMGEVMWENIALDMQLHRYLQRRSID